MGVNSEQSLEDRLSDIEKVVGEGNSDLAREESLVIQLILDPGHQEVNIFGSRAFDRFLHLVTIGPVVLRRTSQILHFYPDLRSPQLTSYLGPADMTGQDCSVQNSVMVPYNMLIWLKKSTVLTAIHSLRSSPSGNITANLRFPGKI